MSRENIKVGEIHLVKEGDNFVACNVHMTENVQTKRGAVLVLDMLKQSMNLAGWTWATIDSVKEPVDAPTNQQAVEGGDTDAAPAKRKKPAKAE